MLLLDTTPNTVGYLIAGYIFLLGAPHLEHLVDLGPAPDHLHHHGAHLHRLPDAAPGP